MFLLRTLSFLVCAWKLLRLERPRGMKALRSRPAVECLEDRTVLAHAKPLYWVGGINGNWSRAGQWWYDGALSQTVKPENGDTVVYDDKATNLPSTDDIPGLSLVSLRIEDPGYQGTLTLKEDLSVGDGVMAARTAATITGKGNLTISGVFKWSQGIIEGVDNAKLIVKSRGELDIGNLSSIRSRPYLKDRVLQIERGGRGDPTKPPGLVTVRGNMVLQGTAWVDNEGKFKAKSEEPEEIRLSGNVWIRDADFEKRQPGELGGSFVNKGVLDIDGVDNPDFTFNMNAFFVQRGWVFVDASTLSINGEGSDMSGHIVLSLGPSNHPGSARLVYSPGTLNTWEAGLEIAGAGSIELESMTVGGGQLPRRKIDAVLRLGVDATISLDEDVQLVTHGGVIERVCPSCGGTLVVEGTADFNGTIFSAVVIDIEGGLAFIQKGDRPFENYVPQIGSDAHLINNGGIIWLTDRYGAFDLRMGSDSEIDLLNGGAMRFDGADINIKPSPNSAGAKIINKGLLFKPSFTGTSVIDPAIDVQRIQGEGREYVGPGSTLKIGGLTINGRPLKGRQGALSIQGSVDFGIAVLTLLQDTLTFGMGTLTIPATSNSGTINPGDAFGGGEIDFPNELDETAFGLIHIDIFGTSEANTFDQVTVHGFATLDGTLEVALNGYTPSTGDTFKILDLPGGYIGTLDLGGFR